jgi:hypothetical protein
MKDGLEGIWMEAAVAWSMYYWDFGWREWAKPRNTSIRVTSVSAEIRTEHFMNKSEGRCNYTRLFGVSTNWKP